MNKSQKQIMEVLDLLKKSNVPCDITIDYVDFEISPYRFSEDLNEQPESKLKNVFKKRRYDYTLNVQIGDGYPLPFFRFGKYRTEQNDININYLKSVITTDYQDSGTIYSVFGRQYEESIINLKRKKVFDDILDDTQPIIEI